MGEVQPVLDRYCVGCHDGTTTNSPDLRAKKEKGWGGFDPSYIALHPYVRRPGPENDYHLPMAFEWHADTSELIQMLKKGHHNVQLSAEDWAELIPRYKAVVKSELGEPFPQDLHAQLWGAIEAVFSSWNTARAVTYRRLVPHVR